LTLGKERQFGSSDFFNGLLGMEGQDDGLILDGGVHRQPLRRRVFAPTTTLT
jgi:hypothetical protein